MSRAVCGVCFCPYGDEGDCACSTEAHYKKVIDDVQALFDAKREQKTQEKVMDKKTEALKLALEALEYISSHYMSLPKIGCMALAAVEEALAEQPAQQQEPVAKPYAYEYGRDNGDGTYSVVIEKGDLVQTAPAVYNYVRPRNAHKDWPIKELFDRPPASKPWVGLTDEEMLEVVHYSQLDNARAIEAKLKEKNT